MNIEKRKELKSSLAAAQKEVTTFFERKSKYKEEILEEPLSAGAVDSFFETFGFCPEVFNVVGAKFKVVGMHTDNLYGGKSKTIIIPICGQGQLQHFHNKKIYYTEYRGIKNKNWKPLFLDDSKPHSFVAEVYCGAILVDVDKKSWKKIRDCFYPSNDLVEV